MPSHLSLVKMKFTLTYAGPLLATGNDPPVQSASKLANIWALRDHFTDQIEAIYENHPAVRMGSTWRAAMMHIRQPISRNGFLFGAIVRPHMDTGCELNIKMLVNHEPGSVITRAGDLDNRLKTLFDALRIPKDNEFRGHCLTQTPNEFYACLLEDDAAITKVCVASERWFGARNKAENEVQLIIEGRVVALRPNQLNEAFALD